MRVSFSQSFLTDIERIDNKIMIDKCQVYTGSSTMTCNPEVIVHGKKIQACIIGVEVDECEKLDFYYGSSLAFSVDGQGTRIKIDKWRTIFEFQLSITPKAEIGCPWLTDDTKFLESIGTDLGNSLYKNIEVSGDSLVWKESIGKYVVESGLQEERNYNIERLDTKTGYLEERPIRFKSYTSINIIQGSWDIDMIKKTKREKQNVYNKISSLSFLVWDSPMSDAKINTSISPECVNKVGEYVDPGNIVFGNTDCFQYINYSSGLVGFKIYGSPGSEVEFLFNKESVNGGYTSFTCKVGENGEGEVTISELKYYHLNGIKAVKPTKLTEIDVITYINEFVDYYVPNPDNTYVATVNKDCSVKINGACEYIEYEKYLGEIKEIGRGIESINSIPVVVLGRVEKGDLSSTVNNLEKSIKVYTTQTFFNTLYTVYQAKIENNVVVKDDTITTSTLVSNYKVKIVMTGKTWKIDNIPNYTDEDGHSIFLLEKKANSIINLEFLTDYLYPNEHGVPYAYNYYIHLDLPEEFTRVFSTRSLDGSGSSVDLEIMSRVVETATGKEWDMYGVEIKTLEENTDDEWRPHTSNDEPIKIVPIFQERSGDRIRREYELESITFSVIQSGISSDLEIWEETFPGEFTKVNENINLYDSLEKRFIVVSANVPNDAGSVDYLWYYYDIKESNKFYIIDSESQIKNTGIIYYDSSSSYSEGIIKLGNEDQAKYCRSVSINRSDLIESLGTLTVTVNPTYPRSWKDLLNSNTVNIGVIREPSEISIKIGSSESSMKDEDYTYVMSGENAKIGVFSVYVESNFKYTMKANENGYLRFVDRESHNYSMSLTKNTFSRFNTPTRYTIALTKLDAVPGGLENSYIDVISGNVTRRIKIDVSNPNVSHSYYESSNLNTILKIYNNGTSAVTNKDLIYYTTTTPKLSTTGFSFFKINSSTLGFDNSIRYNRYIDNIDFTIQNSISVSQSKFPMVAFGTIKESSLSYSDQESAPLVYPFYVKGKEHFIWCVSNLNDFSSITDPIIPSGENPKIDIDSNLYIDATGEEGRDLYIVSRYSIGNKTFITEYPEQGDIKVSSGDREVNIKVSPQQKISLDKNSQIEYAIPINVSCNIENNGGNIFLGSLEYKAITKITDDSVDDVIELDLPISLELDKNYIEENIVSSKEEVLSLKIFQRGTDQDVFDIYSEITDFGIKKDTKYVVPEVGRNISITDLNYELYDEGGGGSSEGLELTSEVSPEYFLITARCDSRLGTEASDHWFSKNNISTISKNNSYRLSIDVTYNKVGETRPIETTFVNNFTRFGCNYGFYVNYIEAMSADLEKCCGFGKVETSDGAPQLFINSGGGRSSISAGIFYAVDGISTGSSSNAETLTVPYEYEFIGYNIPEDVSWEAGKVGEGNLLITFPSRIVGEHGNKHYILHIVHNIDYCPIDLYVDFVQNPRIS